MEEGTVSYPYPYGPVPGQEEGPWSAPGRPVERNAQHRALVDTAPEELSLAAND